MLLIRTKRNMQIFGVIHLISSYKVTFKQQLNDEIQKTKQTKMKKMKKDANILPSIGHSSTNSKLI